MSNPLSFPEGYIGDLLPALFDTNVNNYTSDANTNNYSSGTADGLLPPFSPALQLAHFIGNPYGPSGLVPVTHNTQSQLPFPAPAVFQQSHIPFPATASGNTQSNVPPKENAPVLDPVPDDVDAEYPAPSHGEGWENVSLYRLDNGLTRGRGPRVTPMDLRSKRRALDHVPRTITPASTSTDALLRAKLPSLFTSVPKVSERPQEVHVENPFLDSYQERHPTLDNRVRPRIPPNGVIDGYIKIRLSPNQEANNASEGRGLLGFARRRNVAVASDDDNNPLHAVVPLLPPDFQTGMKLDPDDEKLWKFHVNAFCAGRTLLEKNYWYDEVPAIAAKDEGARHALLAFSTAYVLDFQPTESMRLRANRHYRRAVELLNQALQRQETYQPGTANADGIVIVNWESRRPKDQEPLWRAGARAARQILDLSDPGYRYWKAENVQSSVARIGNANWVAYTDICAQPVTPVTEENTKKMFGWLLEGTEEEVHKIQDTTGVCPKLLYMFSQVTHLAALLQKDPQSTVVPTAASVLRKKLRNFWQWSEHSQGYSSSEELFDSCTNLDENGHVTDAVKVTELSAHAWVPAAEIYLHCRVFRKPRTHPHVVRSLNDLIKCIKMLPCTGPLFTSQSPFFAVFIMAVVSVTPEQRQVSRDWFEVVLSGAQCRSSVPPVWKAIQGLWEWLDNELEEEPYDEDLPIGERQAWWEDMVAKLVEQSGVLSLV
ncbi:hypothetical protein VTJ49DRAFT_5910 [Mycothermus thermophilus]|uniref:Uncharacterized protein n=1 Tax=Humicola insolens TaxID=85995 RepID=A0ABR3V294_HUMIN